MSAARRRDRTGAKGGGRARAAERTSAAAERGRHGARSGRDPRGPQPPAGARRHAARTAIVALLIAAALAILWFFLSRDERSAAVTPVPALPVAALLDSQRAAVAGEQWAKSVLWAGRLASAEPNDPLRMLGLGLAWHNWAWAGSPYDRARSATRTSLERVRMEKRALALLDSAKAFARDNDEAARIRHWGGQIYEIYGLPVDAVLGYQDALEFDPNFALSVPRVRWVVDRLRDPLGGGRESVGGGVP